MKISLYILVVIAAICLLNFWYEFYIQGHYFNHAGLFLAILGSLAPAVVIFIAFLLIKKIKSL